MSRKFPDTFLAQHVHDSGFRPMSCFSHGEDIIEQFAGEMSLTTLLEFSSLSTVTDILISASSIRVMIRLRNIELLRSFTVRSHISDVAGPLESCKSFPPARARAREDEKKWENKKDLDFS